MCKEKFSGPTVDYVFLSDPGLWTTFCVERTGRVRLWEENEAPHFLIDRRAAELPQLFNLYDLLPDMAQWRWQEGFLPILIVSGTSGKQLRLAADDSNNLLLETPEGSILRYPGNQPVSREIWKKNQHRISAFWQNYFASGIVLDDSETDWKSALVQAKCAFCGLHPRYGVECYGDFRSDGFPPTILSMAETEFRFGHRREARELFLYWLERFIRADGSIDYYGPSISEYGDLLRLAALLGTDDDENFRQAAAPAMLKIARLLYDLMNCWTHQEIRETYRLIRGVPEADTRDVPGAYFHNNLAVLRSFYAWSEVFAPVVRKENIQEMRYMAQLLARRLQQALAAFRDLPYLPWRADFDPANLPETMTDTCESAYANYRYYPEMLQSGLLPAEDARKIIQAREDRGGDENGMTVFHWPDGADWLDNWPIASYAKGLLEYGDRERFERVLNGHRRYYQTQDTFTAYESIQRTGSPRLAATDWCVPAQLALPLMLLLQKEFQPAPASWKLAL